MEAIVRILDIQAVTHDVKCFRFEKPQGFRFEPGQATDVSINMPGWEKELRPFTFTCLNSDPYLEFTIKRYDDHHGVTERLHQLKPGDELIVRDAWGAIEYKGPGYFIAGGAGITPFISIFRHLHATNALADNQLFFSNKTPADVIYRQELEQMLGDKALFLFSRGADAQQNTRINEAFLKTHVTGFSRHFYVCGPDPMIAEIAGILERCGASADSVVFEK